MGQSNYRVGDLVWVSRKHNSFWVGLGVIVEEKRGTPIVLVRMVSGQARNSTGGFEAALLNPARVTKVRKG